MLARVFRLTRKATRGKLERAVGTAGGSSVCQRYRNLIRDNPRKRPLFTLHPLTMRHIVDIAGRPIFGSAPRLAEAGPQATALAGAMCAKRKRRSASPGAGRFAFDDLGIKPDRPLPLCPAICTPRPLAVGPSVSRKARPPPPNGQGGGGVAGPSLGTRLTDRTKSEGYMKVTTL